ncbi:MAG: hypothetical protein L6437_07705 [Kiritimatiellae bacterium]|nr:hypothetical protein [Kiritimatiellia bacterium]
MWKWALTLCAVASPNVTGTEAALNPFPHHRSRKDRQLSIATLGGAHHRHETMPVLRQHQEHPHPPKRSIAGATTHPDSRAATVAPHGLRLLNTDQVRRPMRFARRGGIAPRRLKQTALREDTEDIQAQERIETQAETRQ